MKRGHQTPAPQEGKLIHADELESLTGLTDRRHRQLAKEGWFPPPKESQYEMVTTLRGLFRYYREQGSRETPRAQLMDEQRKGQALRNRMREVEAEQAAGRLRPIDDLREAYAVSMDPLKAALDTMPDVLGVRCNPTDPTHATLVLREWTRRTREQMAAACDAALAVPS